MKNRSKSIIALKLEIEELDKTIEQAEKFGKKAFAKRLNMIKEEKLSLLERWISNS